MSDTNFVPGTVISSTWLNDINDFVYTIDEATGASQIGSIQTGTGAVLRTVQDKIRERVTVKDFGAIGDGVADDTLAIQAAIDSFTTLSGTLYFPRGVYRITAPIVVTLSSMQLQGESPADTYLTSDGGSTFDLLRMAGAYCRVTGIHFRPGGTQYCMRVYAAHCTIENNRFLAAVTNVGGAILLTDLDPDTAAFVAGAYTHTIYNNLIGVSGFAFANAIDDGTTQGLQACKFLCNQILSDSPIRVTRGGGNTYIGNLLQTSSGTIGTPVGNGIDLGANVTGEMIYGNYFEKFQNAVITRQLANTYQNAHVTGNQFDNCTNRLMSLGNTNYLLEDPILNTHFQNGWTTDYGSSGHLTIRTLLGATAFGCDSDANFCAGLTNSSSHHIRKIGTEGTILLQIDGGLRGSYFSTVDGVGGTAAFTALNIGENLLTGRSINAGGTLNASGADYAEYMYKAVGCATIPKGQIIGIDANGKLTDKWADAVTFAIKSTDPSYVGGDNWARHLGDRPQNQADWPAFDVLLEEARQKVDRVAFAGQVPVNVMGTTPGQYIVPVQDGAGIKGIAKNEADLTLSEYMRAVGKVIALEADGRARIIVKIS